MLDAEMCAVERDLEKAALRVYGISCFGCVKAILVGRVAENN